MRLNNFTVPGDELRIRGGVLIENESLAGNTSATTRTNNGIKPKTFYVRMLIKFKNASQLTELIRTAEAQDEKGNMVVYDVVDPTINTANVRQVQFDGNLSWRDHGTLRAWQVSFNLVEFRSVPEKNEKRKEEAKQAVTAQSAEGQEIPTVDTIEDAQTRQLTRFETLLARIDNLLAPDESNETTQN